MDAYEIVKNVLIDTAATSRSGQEEWFVQQGLDALENLKPSG